MDKPEPKHIYAKNKIMEIIRDLEIDDKIPGERVIAKELGISYMTIRKAVESLVTDGVLYKISKKGTFIADPKKAKIKTKNIGYFLDSSIKEGVSSPYYSMIFDALEKEAGKKGYTLMFFSGIGEGNSQKTLEKIDGAIISCFPRIEDVVQDIKRLMPVVVIDNSSSDESLPSVIIDNFNAVAESINYLCSLGHERIGFITGLDDSDIGRNRLAGYQNALRANGIGEDMDLVYKGDYSFKTGADGAEFFLSLDRRPTAIMCANDTMAIGAMKDVSKKGLSIPDDISIIGFDDIYVASHMTPSLTTVAAPVEEIAKHALHILSSLINDNEPDNRHITVPGQLVLRDTCASIVDSMIDDRKLETL
ncbi:MAG: GntR family transcriptional regulator [Gammaproteobacteria bacterium]|nr:GntR family transcriptional regulator [Gammaproteobacteria bacterium]